MSFRKDFSCVIYLFIILSSQRKELTIVSLPNSNINSAGDLSPFGNLLQLDLSASLIPTWNVLADILKQLPKLDHLDLS